MNWLWESGLLPALVLAQAEAGGGDAAVAGGEGAAPAGGASLFGGGMLPLLLIFLVVFWFFVFRPEGKRQKARAAMLKSVKKGDSVVTTGGILGKVYRVEEKEVVIQVDKDTKTKLRFLKSAVGEVLPPDGGSDKDSVEEAKKQTAKSG